MTIAQVRRALRRRRSQYRALRLSLRDAYIRTDLEGRITDSNLSFRELTGYTRRELRALSSAKLTPEAWRSLESAIVKDQVLPLGVSEPYEKELHRKDGSLVRVEVRTILVTEGGQPVGLCSVMCDITERRRAAATLKRGEESLRAAQRLEAVGRLAAGVAHDYNNLLTAILGYADLITDRLPAGSRARSDMEELRKAADRATALTKQLLAFSRQQILQPVALDLSSCITGLDKLLRRLVRENVELVTRLAPSLPRVIADPAQITQVVANLVVNAVDAMPHGGRITIATAEVDLYGHALRSQLSGSPDRAITLTVSDTGTGIAPDLLPHIFEPFFSTKGVGGGTGLGLAAVYGIVKQSGGHIAVEGEPGCGATFTVYLPPLLAGSPDAAKAGPAALADVGVGKATVLVVEDDADVRTMVRRTLERDGYSVLEAAGGRDAIAAARNAGRRVDALVTDIVMPDMSGMQTAEALRRTNPDLVVLLMSGYADPDIFASIPRADLANFVPKPFEPEVLRRRLRQAMPPTSVA
ncbi:MAG: ATP-binding protein [Acidobacteriota bacterium]